jgi:subtilisin family serine protease
MTRSFRHQMPQRLVFVLAALLGAALLAGMVGGPLPAASAGAPDPILPQQWALAKIHAQEAWATSTGVGVVVAVVDSGVDFEHEDLRGQSAGSFTCMGTCAPGGGDVNGHGTAVASVIAAGGNNGVGIAGVAPGAKVLSVRVLEADGTGSVGDVSRGITFAAEQGAKVINVSIGTSIDLPIVFGLLSPELQAAIDAAWAKGAVVVAAAGNGGLASSFTSMAHLFVVGATGPNDEIAHYSSSLTGVELHAPGGNHVGDRCSAVACITVAESPNIYRATEGTSFAAPHVSGVAAELAALGLSNADIVGRLKATGDPIVRGLRLNAAKAVGPPPAGTSPAAPPSPAVLAAPPVVRFKPAAPAPKLVATPVPSPSPSPSPPPPPPPEPSPSPAQSPVAQAAESGANGSADKLMLFVAAGLLLALVGGGGVFVLIRRRGT